MRGNRRSLGNAERLPLALLVSLGALAGLAFIFLKLWSEIAEGETHAFDEAFLLALRVPGHPDTAIGPHWLPQIMIDLTSLGSGTFHVIIMVVVAGFLIVKGARRKAILLLAAISSGRLAVILLKDIFDRPRPELVDHLVQVQSLSFPSGHAANSAIVYLTMGILLTRVEEGRWVRAYIMISAIALTLAVGLSRLYLGVHWPSDVAAGWAFGAAWAIAWGIADFLVPGRERPERGDAVEGDPRLSSSPHSGRKSGTER